MEQNAERDARTFVERVSEDRGHCPWWYTEYGVLCACGRPCLLGEDCAVLLRARRWEDERDGVER